MKKSFFIILLISLPSLSFAQYLELGHLGLKGPVKSSLEQFNDGNYSSVFRMFEEDGRVVALGIKRKKSENTWDDYLNAFIYHDDNTLQLMHTKKNDKPVKLEEYEYLGDTLLVTISTEEKGTTEKRYFDEENRKYYWITPKITSFLEFDKDYLPKYYKKVTTIGDFESEFNVTVLKKDQYGNWLEAKMTYKDWGTRRVKNVTWKRDLEYYK